MDVLEAIFTRRSIRKFTGEPISDSDLRTILNAGFCAPSARNIRPQEFVVIRNPETLKRIADTHPYAKMVLEAGCAIIVCGDTSKQSWEGYVAEDCSASIENMLLAAHGLGLGAVWCGLYPVTERTKAIREIINLPESIIPVGLVVLGHKNEEREAPDRYEEHKVHFEKW